MPLQGLYPTSWWREGEVISETVTLDMRGVAAGAYRLGVGLYDRATRDRLAIVDAAGTPVPGGRLDLGGTIDW
jgi:hypothetical protein